MLNKVHEILDKGVFCGREPFWKHLNGEYTIENGNLQATEFLIWKNYAPSFATHFLHLMKCQITPKTLNRFFLPFCRNIGQISTKIDIQG